MKNMDQKENSIDNFFEEPENPVIDNSNSDIEDDLDTKVIDLTISDPQVNYNEKINLLQRKIEQEKQENEALEVKLFEEQREHRILKDSITEEGINKRIEEEIKGVKKECTNIIDAKQKEYGDMVIGIRRKNENLLNEAKEKSDKELIDIQKGYKSTIEGLKEQKIALHGEVGELYSQVNEKTRKIKRKNKGLWILGAATLLLAGFTSWFGYDSLKPRENPEKPKVEITKEIEDYKEKLSAKDDTIDFLQRNSKANKNLINSLETKLKKARVEYEGLKQEYNSMSGELDVSEYVTKGLEKELLGKEKLVNSLEGELEVAKKESEKLEKKHKKAIKQLTAVSPKIEYVDINMGDCKYELTNKQAKELGFDMPYEYSQMRIFKNHVILYKDKAIPVKIYSRNNINKPVNFKNLELEIMPDSNLIIHDKGLFEFINELENEE